MNLTHSVSVLELIWTIVALPGAILWGLNRHSATMTLRAARLARVGNGRRVYANFAVKETSAWLGIEVLFLALGVLSMFVEPTSSEVKWPAYVITFGMIAASLIITYLAFAWRGVDAVILEMARHQPITTTDKPDQETP